MSKHKIHILLGLFCAMMFQFGCSDLTFNETECAVPGPDAPTGVPPAFMPNREQGQACIAIYNQSDVDVTVTLTHDDRISFDMRQVVLPGQAAVYMVPAGNYSGSESYPVGVENHGNMKLKRGHCYEWLVGREQRRQDDD